MTGASSLPARRRCWFALLAFLAATAAAAHEYWFEREADALVLYQGHLYASHKDEERVRYDPAIVKRALCVRESGTTELPRGTTYPARFPGPCAGVFVQTSSGYWSQTLTGTRNQPKSEVAGALRSWLSEESIKFIDKWTPALGQPLTQGLELVPLVDPRAVALGDKLKLLAVWNGKPRAGVTVAYQGEPRGVSGADGTVNIRLRARGVQIIAASFEEPISDARADKAVRTTILQFEKP